VTVEEMLQRFLAHLINIAYRDAVALARHKSDCRCVGILSPNLGAGAQAKTIVAAYQRLFVRANWKRRDSALGIHRLPTTK